MPLACDCPIGLDHPKAYTRLVVEDGGGKVLRSGRVRHDPRSLAGVLRPHLKNGHAEREASRKGTAMFDWLDELCEDKVPAQRLRVKAIADTRPTRRSWRICCGPV
jgi:hypothetical protein